MWSMVMVTTPMSFSTVASRPTLVETVFMSLFPPQTLIFSPNSVTLTLCFRSIPLGKFFDFFPRRRIVMDFHTPLFPCRSR